jgi:hypothetical protein
LAVATAALSVFQMVAPMDFQSVGLKAKLMAAQTASCSVDPKGDR